MGIWQRLKQGLGRMGRRLARWMGRRLVGQLERLRSIWRMGSHHLPLNPTHVETLIETLGINGTLGLTYGTIGAPPEVLFLGTPPGNPPGVDVLRKLMQSV